MHPIALPTLKTDSQLAFQTEESARQWLASQPQTQPLLMLAALKEQIDAIDAANLPPQTALNLLDALRKAAVPQQSTNEARYTRKALPMQAEDQRCFEVAYRLWADLAIAYLRLADQLPPDLMALALNRTASSLRLAQYCHFLAACECPQLLDELLFVTLTKSIENQSLLTPLADPDYPHLGDSTAAGHISWALLLRLIDPYRLSATQLTVANRGISRWRELAIFQPNADDAAKGLTIDLTQAFPAASHATGTRFWLNVRSVSRKIRNRIDALNAGESPDSLKLGRELSPGATLRLLNLLQASLQRHKPRTSTEVGEIELCFGTENAYAVFKEALLNPHGAMDEKAATLAHQRMAMFGFDRLSQMPSAVKKLNVPSESWNMVDGKALRHPSEDSTRRISPCLIATKTGTQARLGLMSGLLMTASGTLSAELMWFDEEIEAGWLKQQGALEQIKPKQAVFLLSRGSSLSLIVPVNSNVRPDTKIMLEGISCHQLIVGQALERGTDFVRYACSN